MKRTLGIVVVMAAVLCLTASANATLVVKDTFTDPAYPKNLVGHVPEIGGAWTVHSGTTGPIQIIADHPPIGADGSAFLMQTTGHTEDDNTAFTGGEEKYWAGFCVKVEAVEPLGNVYFAHFKDTGTSNFPARVGITDPGVTDFQFALFTGSTTAGPIWPTPILYGTWHRVVTAYERTSGLQEMWVDPDPNLGPYDVGQVPVISWTGWAGTTVSAYALRQGNTTGGTQTIDNLAVGNNLADWPEVASPCIPEPATLALLGLAGLALVRRR